MNKQYKSKKGDISLLVTLLVCSIILILLAPLAQKVSVEAKISRENLMSQQAIQAAKTGLERWVYDTTTMPFNINISTTNTFELDPTLGIQYKVDFNPRSGSTPAYIVSTGIVTRGGITIERVLEERFELASLTPAPETTAISTINHSFDNDTNQDISLNWSNNDKILNITSENKTAPDDLVSPEDTAKYYEITFKDPGYTSLTVDQISNMSASRVNYPSGMQVSRIQKGSSNTQWRIWFSDKSLNIEPVTSFKETRQRRIK